MTRRLFRRLPLHWSQSLQEMPKRSLSLVPHGCYWRAGEDVPPEELPAFARKYVLPAPKPSEPASTQATAAQGREEGQRVGPLS